MGIARRATRRSSQRSLLRNSLGANSRAVCATDCSSLCEESVGRALAYGLARAAMPSTKQRLRHCVSIVGEVCSCGAPHVPPKGNAPRGCVGHATRSTAPYHVRSARECRRRRCGRSVARPRRAADRCSASVVLVNLPRTARGRFFALLVGLPKIVHAGCAANPERKPVSLSNGVAERASRSTFVIGARLHRPSRRCRCAAVVVLLEPTGAPLVFQPRKYLAAFVLDAPCGRRRVLTATDSFQV